MAIFDIERFTYERPGTSGLVNGLRDVVACVRRWYEWRQTTVRLLHLEERLLRDIGIETCDVFDALDVRDPPLWEKLHADPANAVTSLAFGPSTSGMGRTRD